MSDKIPCSNDAVARYTWPGQDEAFCCVYHANQIKWVANGLGFPLQVIPLKDDEHKVCESSYSEAELEAMEGKG